MILDGRDPASVQHAAEALRAGELLGLPTETVYGLAADADQDAAVAQIFTAKGRPGDHPLIVHLADAQGVDHYAQKVPDFARPSFSPVRSSTTSNGSPKRALSAIVASMP